MNNKLANNIMTILIILITCLMIFGVMNLLNIKIEEGMDNQSNNPDGVQPIVAAGGTVIYINNGPAAPSNKQPTISPTTFPPTTFPPTTFPPDITLTPATSTLPPSIESIITMNGDTELVVASK